MPMGSCHFLKTLLISRGSAFLFISLLLACVLGAEYWRPLLFSYDSPAAQWILASSITFYLLCFTFLLWRLRRNVGIQGGLAAENVLLTNNNLSTLLLMGLLTLGLIGYARKLTTSAATAEFIAFFGGATIGQGLTYLNIWHRNHGPTVSIRFTILSSLVVGLTLAALFQPEESTNYQYLGLSRWGGLWGNPNIYGLLMGLGVTLAAGQFIISNCFSMPEEHENSRMNKLDKIWSWSWKCLCVMAAVIMGIGLVKSYSRGAWLATSCGIAYLVYGMKCYHGWRNRMAMSSVSNKDVKSNDLNIKWRRWLHLVAVVFLSLFILALWNYRDTDHRMVRRTISVANKQDMSWRNRIIASIGALQMISAKPWLGCGWNQPETVYNAYYRPSKLIEGKAIILNDYLMLGMMLGLPALGCLLAWFYSVFSFGHQACIESPLRLSIAERESAVCRAGVVVLFIGFIFNGGLFNLALGTLWWILLGLGAPVTDGGKSAFCSRLQRCLVVFALAVAFFGVMFWAHSIDSFQRIEFKLAGSGKESVHGIAILPKLMRSCPVIVYLHGSGQDLMSDGGPLRQLAELGIAAVGIEYNQNNAATFDEQFRALSAYLQQQPWAMSDATAWVGFNLGARKMLRFLLNNPESSPRLMVCLASDPLSEPRVAGDSANGKHVELGKPPQQTGKSKVGTNNVYCPILFLHGNKDEVFPIQDMQRLADRLRTSGRTVTVKVLPGSSHGLDPDQCMIMRLVGEYCKSVLTPENRFGGIVDKHTTPFWIYLLPACLIVIWACADRARDGVANKKILIKISPADKGLHRLAWGLAFVALGQTIVHLAVPRLAANEATLRIARNWLLSPRYRKDFTYLSSNPIWHGKPLKVLLEHVELANYNRELVNWRMDDPIFREYVLSPIITAQLPEELCWRYALWDAFYPRIRKAQTPEAAANILVRHLRERVTIAANPVSTQGVESMWKHQVTDQKGFQALYVAALRSVGVAAKQNANRVEIWANNQWSIAPQPILSSFISTESR